MSAFAYSQISDARSQLRARWGACHRWRKYTANATILTLAGLLLLYIVVDHMSVNRYLAHAIVVPLIMFVVSYIVHRHRSFGDRKIRRGSSQRRYTLIRLSGMGISKVSFVMLVAVAELPYLLVSIMITLALAGPTYILNRDWAFAEEASQETEKA